MRRFHLALASGVLIATLLSLFVLVSSLWRSAPTSETYGVSVRAIVLTYYAAGIIGGSLIGLVLCFGNNWGTRISGSLIAAFTLFFCIAVARDGLVNWDGGRWLRVLVPTLVFGVVFAIMSRHDFPD